MDERQAIGDKNEIVKPEKCLLVVGDIDGDPAAMITPVTMLSAPTCALPKTRRIFRRCPSRSKHRQICPASSRFYLLESISIIQNIKYE